MMKYIINIIGAGIPTIIAGVWIVRYANECRGYEAIGGEWFLVIMIFATLYFFVDKVMHH